MLIKKGYLIVLFALAFLGCKEIKDVKPRVTNSSVHETYEIEIRNNKGIYATGLSKPLGKAKPIVFLTVPKRQKLFFENGTTKETFNVMKTFEGGIPFFKFSILSKQENSERLFGQLIAFAGTQPQYDFKGYAFLGKTNRIYNPLKKSKQELSHSHDWLNAWDTCEGYTALKKDGSLWQFGKLGGCNWGQLHGVFMDAVDRNIYTYILSPKKIADGFKDAKVINGGSHIYLIKKDGTLWTFGQDNKSRLVQKSASNDWVSVAIDIGVHDGVGYDIGLKKDGSLWEVSPWSENKPKPLSKKDNWDKILMDDTCCRVYAQKKNGSIFSSHNGIDFNEVTSKNDFSGSEINNYSKLLVEMKKLKSNSANNYKLYTDEVEVRKDGTLWLRPKVGYESVKKEPVSITPVEGR